MKVLALLFLAVAVRSGDCFFHHKKVVEIPVHLKPVHVQPVIVEKPEVHEIHHIEPPSSTPAAQSEGHKAHLQQIWNHVKNTVGNHKIVRHFYHRQPAQPEPQVPHVPAPEFDVWPSLGFSHYKKVHYIPVLPTQAPHQADFEFEYLPQDFGRPLIPETPVFPEFPKKPTDFESSVSGDQLKQTSIPSVVSEQNNVKTVPSPPSYVYGVPPKI